MANYTRGDNKNIIVGAAALFVHNDGPIDLVADPTSVPDFVAGTSYKDTLSNDAAYTNIGYTANGVDIEFQPNFGEVMVDQLLDVAKLFKQGMQVNLKTTLTEATLENLLVAIAGKESDKTTDTNGLFDATTLNLSAGDLGDVPLERGLIAVGPGSGDGSLTGNDKVERVYIAYRALSINNVTVSAKRDAATEFAVDFRLLPDNNASYGKIVDRTLGYEQAAS